MSATGTPSFPCLRMNAFCASENCDAFIVFRSSQPRENTAENSNSERSSFRGADQFYALGRGLSNVRSAELVGGAQPIACCGEICSISRRREVAQRRVRPLLVVVVDPVRNP